ncbi:hypothetical protein OK016_13565 [Vibrio chagasii]|nr:hypothetical protein [Vibrio chagasii]
MTSDEPFKQLLCQGMVISRCVLPARTRKAPKSVCLTDAAVERDGKGRITSAKDNQGRDAAHQA